jgi:superkiller protein 3
MRPAVRFLLLVWFLAPFCAQAANHDPWLRIKSANFELFTNAGERSGRDLIRHFEQVRSFFAQAFQLQGTRARPAQVIAFRSEKEYAPYRPNGFATAFFQGGSLHDFIVMQSASKEHYPVAVHEYTHLLLRQAELALPVWLNEGIAELYSNLEPQGSKIVVGKVIRGRAQTLLSEKWISLRVLLAVEPDSPLYNEKARAGMFYAESWLLVHMLQMSPAYTGKLAALADALKHGNNLEAFEQACGKPAEQVDTDLRDYMNSPAMNARLFPVQLPKSVDTPEIEASAALPARLALAELRQNSRASRDRGRFDYEQLIREFPDRWEAEAGLGRFFAGERNYAEAAKHFARAAGLGSKDTAMYLEYGKQLIYSGRTAEAIAPFETATALDPRSTEAHVELGIALTHVERFREAVEEFQKIKSITPVLAPRYFYNFAFACYRLGGLAEARELIRKARTHTWNPEEIAALDRLSQALTGGR